MLKLMRMNLKLQKSKLNSCLPTAFAIACDADVELFSVPDGTVKVWNDLPHPYCYRGWHLQECILSAYILNYSTTVLSPEIWLGPDSEHLTTIKNDIPICSRMVLITETHAVASDGVKVFDPKGYIYNLKKLSDYIIVCLINKIAF